MPEEFIGSGWAMFPMGLDASGGIAMVSGDNEIREALRLVLGTAKGERPMRPEFGCGIHDFVFDNANTDIAGRIAYHVRESIIRWEPRVDLDDVTVTFDPAEPSTVYINVSYQHKETNDPRNLVFPFYFIPEE